MFKKSPKEKIRDAFEQKFSGKTEQTAQFFDDMARMTEGAFSAFAGIRQDLEAQVRQATERLLQKMDMVTRDEFEATKELAVKALARVEELEKKLAAKNAVKSAKPVTKAKSKSKKK